MSKPKVAFYWCASCGGCEETIVDLDEAILDVLAAVDIVFWPCAMDFKRADVEAMADGEIDVSFVNGAIRTSEQEEMAHLMRRKSKVVVAFGACAQMGGIPGLANLVTRQTILDYVYSNSPSVVNAEGMRPKVVTDVPEGKLDLPRLYHGVRPLDQVIEVEYYVPGCPPTAAITLQALQAFLTGNLPPKGSVLAGDRALCHECALNETKPEKLLVSQLKRMVDTAPKLDTCLLAQGILCLGPATRGGCGALCISAHMPCTGCFGPLDRVHDYGGKALSTIASIVDQTEPGAIAEALRGVPDPAGTFYRYSLAASFVGAGERPHAPEVAASATTGGAKK